MCGRSTDPKASKSDLHRSLCLRNGLFNAPALVLDGPLWFVGGALDAVALLAAGVEKVEVSIGLEGFDGVRQRGQRKIVISPDMRDAGRQPKRCATRPALRLTPRPGSSWPQNLIHNEIVKS